MSEDSCRLFVYGTLRRALNRTAYRKLIAPRSTYTGLATCRGRLYDLGSYPGLVAPRHEDERVTGEVYRLRDDERDETLALLDRFEGCDRPDPEYKRVRCRVTLEEGTFLMAWVYRYRLGTDTARPIPGGDYLAYLERRKSA